MWCKTQSMFRYLLSLVEKQSKRRIQIHSRLKPLEPYIFFFPCKVLFKKTFFISFLKPKEKRNHGQPNWAHSAAVSEGVLASVWDDKSPNISLGACVGLKRNTASLQCIHFLRHKAEIIILILAILKELLYIQCLYDFQNYLNICRYQVSKEFCLLWLTSYITNLSVSVVFYWRIHKTWNIFSH